MNSTDIDALSASPLISVCVPIYNNSATLARCLRSIVDQDGDFEILVVDDASSDDSVAVAATMLRPGDRLTVNESNLGQVQNHNRCLELARGRYIQFVHCDDYLLPGALQKLARCFDDPTRGTGFRAAARGDRRPEVAESSWHSSHSFPEARGIQRRSVASQADGDVGLRLQLDRRTDQRDVSAPPRARRERVSLRCHLAKRLGTLVAIVAQIGGWVCTRGTVGSVSESLFSRFFGQMPLVVRSASSTDLDNRGSRIPLRYPYGRRNVVATCMAAAACVFRDQRAGSMVAYEDLGPRAISRVRPCPTDA